MTREKKIQFNVNEVEYKTLKDYSEQQGISMAEVLRDYIKSLKSRPPLRVHDGACTQNFRSQD